MKLLAYKMTLPNDSDFGIDSIVAYDVATQLQSLLIPGYLTMIRARIAVFPPNLFK